MGEGEGRRELNRFSTHVLGFSIGRRTLTFYCYDGGWLYTCVRVCFYTPGCELPIQGHYTEIPLFYMARYYLTQTSVRENFHRLICCDTFRRGNYEYKKPHARFGAIKPLRTCQRSVSPQRLPKDNALSVQQQRRHKNQDGRRHAVPNPQLRPRSPLLCISLSSKLQRAAAVAQQLGSLHTSHTFQARTFFVATYIFIYI